MDSIILKWIEYSPKKYKISKHIYLGTSQNQKIWTKMFLCLKWLYYNIFNGIIRKIPLKYLCTLKYLNTVAVYGDFQIMEFYKS